MFILEHLRMGVFLNTPLTMSTMQQIHIGKPLVVTDLGQPIPGESIFALTIDRSANVLYGLTSPNAHFFAYSIASGKFTDFGVVAKNIPEGEKFEKDKMMSRMLVVDQAGNVFASGENGDFFRFDSKTQKLEKLSSMPLRSQAGSLGRGGCFPSRSIRA